MSRRMVAAGLLNHPDYLGGTPLRRYEIRYTDGLTRYGCRGLVSEAMNRASVGECGRHLFQAIARQMEAAAR